MVSHKTKFTKQNGMYVIQGSKFESLVGSRAQVLHGTAYKTTGNLTKKDLMMNKHGRIVSRKKHVTAKKEKRLDKAGYKKRKGVFVLSRKSTRRKTR